MWPKILQATAETLYLVTATLFFASIAGLLLGLLLYATRPGNVLQSRAVHLGLNLVINVVRPIPFIIFIVALTPVTRAVIGTSIGPNAAIFAMTIAAALSVARIVENNLVAVPVGVVEAAAAMGASPFTILVRVVVPEALGPLILGLTYILVALIDFSAMAGVVGGGGLGSLAMVYGYQRFEIEVMLITIVILVLLVQLAQLLGNKLTRIIMRR
ncbi:methionine ABC transporter permease [Agromyces silvae]|uniref:methionine ABC transporter permease n=1 Tax=Agromyces silvae TaxID=3388266 RepID=UPI00280AE8C9|nr:methionine ABC transporter permease [Agromyces protaetiae]